MDIRFAAIVATVVGIAGCSTPVTTLRNDATGQVVRCGGGSTGSIAGGLIGYHIEKDDDARCVRDYEAQGFRKVQ